MINIVKVISTSFNNAKNRLVKFTRMGKFDTQDTKEYGPYGFDSNPIVGMRAIYADTGNIGKPVIIGYLNLNQLAAVGEARIYSTDADGVLKSWVWVKNDGTMQLGGTADNAVRYSSLNTGLQNEKDAINTELQKIQAAITGLGGAYARVPITVDITASKINEIKTL